VSKWRPFSSIFNWRNNWRKEESVGDDSHIVFVGGNRSLSRCVVEMQQSVLLQPKFGAKSLHIFTQSPQNITVLCRIDCLACQDEFLLNNRLDVKENDEIASNTVYSLCFFVRTLVQYISWSPSHFETFIQFYSVSLSVLSRNCIPPHTRLQIKGHKNQHFYPAI
jgi:hypothetical protein